MSLDFYIRCDHCFSELGNYNCTHNLTAMAAEAGIYECLWHPKDIKITTAQQMIPLLRDGLTKLEEDPERYRKLNPENGWGTYDGFLSFVRSVLSACEKFPNGVIHAST